MPDHGGKIQKHHYETENLITIWDLCTNRSYGDLK